MRKVIIIFLIIIPLNLYSSVYDFVKDKMSISLPFVSGEIQKMNVRINGNKMDILLFESDKSAEYLLSTLYSKAESSGCYFYNNEDVFNIANLLYEIAGKKKYEEEFGYIFYKEKSNKINFIIIAGDGYKSEIIKISSKINNKRTKEFDDGVGHISGAEKVFGFEILSNTNTTKYFANFYRVLICDKYEIRNFYNNSLKKTGFKIINKNFNNEVDFFICEKKRKNYIIAISEKQNETWIMVMG